MSSGDAQVSENCSSPSKLLTLALTLVKSSMKKFSFLPSSSFSSGGPVGSVDVSKSYTSKAASKLSTAKWDGLAAGQVGEEGTDGGSPYNQRCSGQRIPWLPSRAGSPSPVGSPSRRAKMRCRGQHKPESRRVTGALVRRKNVVGRIRVRCAFGPGSRRLADAGRGMRQHPGDRMRRDSVWS